MFLIIERPVLARNFSFKTKFKFKFMSFSLNKLKNI